QLLIRRYTTGDGQLTVGVETQAGLDAQLVVVPVIVGVVGQVAFQLQVVLDCKADAATQQQAVVVITIIAACYLTIRICIYQLGAENKISLIVDRCMVLHTNRQNIEITVITPATTIIVQGV